MNVNILNMQIFHFIKYELRSLLVTKCHFYIYLKLSLRSYGQLFVLVFCNSQIQIPEKYYTDLSTHAIID